MEKTIINQEKNKIEFEENTKISFKYHPIHQIGKGAFGEVFSSIDSHGKIVAVKKIIINSSLKNRELNILKKLDSPYCLKLLDYKITSSNQDENVIVQLVTEILPMSLGKYLYDLHRCRNIIPCSLFKIFFYQLFKGLEYLHSLGIAHRDIKPHNILINPSNGILKICDFGSAKDIINDSNSTPDIGSRYYKAPEVLLGSRKYTEKIDIWGAGCVIAETLLDGMPMFQGDDNIDQIVQIIKILGPPTEDDIDSFEHPIPFPKIEQIATLEQALPLRINNDLKNILEGIFVYNPKKRLSAKEILLNPYFSDIQNSIENNFFKLVQCEKDLLIPNLLSNNIII